MDEIVKTFLLADDKFLPEIHLKQPGLTYSSCGPFTKNEQNIQKIKETGNKSYIYKNELDEACFQHDMTYGTFKDLKRRTASDDILRYKTFNNDENPKYDGYQRGLASLVYKFFDKKSASLPDKSVSGSCVANNEIKQSLKLAKELHKELHIIRESKKRKVYSGFRDNIWGTDLADMQLIIYFNKGFRLLLCVIDIFIKYSWVVPLKARKGISNVNALQKILKESDRSEGKSKRRKPNKIWVDKGSQFYYISFKK